MAITGQLRSDTLVSYLELYVLSLHSPKTQIKLSEDSKFAQWCLSVWVNEDPVTCNRLGISLGIGDSSKKIGGWFYEHVYAPHSYNRAFHSHNLFISSFFLQVVYDKGEMYSFSKYGRFCQEIKLNYSPYKNYFTRVFWNRSYHVYKVNSVISFQYWRSFCLSWWCMLILYLALCINVMEN